MGSDQQASKGLHTSVRPTPTRTFDEVVEECEQDTIMNWWSRASHEDAELYIAKNAEYGDMDLRIIGYTLREMCGELPPAHCEQEIGIAFYALGKIARIVSAYGQGKTPGNDSWKDLTIYSMMARRAREGKL